MAKTLIGTGTTNSQGVAVCNNPYVGTGAGVVNVLAETEIDGSVVSEPYTLWDTLFYDDGVTSPKIATWSNYSDRLTVTVDSTNGTTLLRDDASGTGYYFADDNSTTGFYDFPTPIAIEFKLVSATSKNSCGIDFVKGNDNNKSFNQLGITDNDNVKITYDGTTIRVYVNGGTTPTELSVSLTSPIGIGFFVGAEESVTYKDFKIYPI